ncbi:MAG: hypothetical protein ACOC5U_04310 [Candidatus Aminicenantaceae bacterium]
MRKWLFLLGFLAVVYVIVRLNSKKENKSPFFTQLNEAVTIAVWAVLIAYLLVLGYHLYTMIFK